MKKTKTLLYIFSVIGFTTLTVITVKASSFINVIDGASILWQDDWFKATIVDFYNNQILIYFWIIYKEKSAALLIIFFALSICFGSFFSIAYVIYHLICEQNVKDLICKTKREL